jgi:putative ABC transport system permease protein
MMSSRWKKIWADIWGNKSRTILTIITIAVGVLAVGFNSSLGLYVAESLESDYLSSRPSEATVYAGPLDDKMVKIAREVPGVDAVEGRRSVSATVVRADNKQIFIQFTAVEDLNQLTINTLKPARGESSLPSLGEKQILVDASAQSLGYQVGDKITVELGNGRLREVTLAGYIHDVNSVPTSFSQLMTAYVTPKTLDWLGGAPSYDALAISVTEKQTDPQHVTQVAQAVADRVERAGATIYFVNVFRPGHHFAYDTANGVFSILTVLGYMTVFLSIFLVVNTITALMAQQTRQIGIMKAVGGGNGQVFVMYLVLILVFGLGSLAIAVPIANSLAKTFGAGMAQYLNVYPAPYVGYRSALIQQVIVALVVPVLAAMWPIYNSVRVTVREAVSDYGIGGNAKPKDKSVGKGALILTRPMRLSLRNAFRKKARLILTLITLVLAGAIFIGVYNLWASFDKVIEDIQGYFLADINMSFGRYYRFDEVAAIAESVPGVSSVEGWTEYSGTLITGKPGDGGTQIMFVAPPSTSTLIDPVITAGRWLTTGDENAIVIGNHLLNIFPDLKVGDWLTIKVDDKEIKWHIVGVYSITGNVNPPLLYVSYEYLSQLVGAPGQVYSLRVLTEQHDEISQRRISDQLQKLYESHGIGINSTQLGGEFIRQQKAQTNILVYFMLGMAAMIAIVGGLGLTGTMSINVLERTREIGVMRAIGASNGDIQSIVIVEGLVVGLLSWALSIPLSLPITGVLCVGVGMAILTAPMPVVLGMTGIIAWLIFTLGPCGGRKLLAGTSSFAAYRTRYAGVRIEM